MESKFCSFFPFRKIFQVFNTSVIKQERNYPLFHIPYFNAFEETLKLSPLLTSWRNNKFSIIAEVEITAQD
jgi:hypothetical protein